MGFVQSLRMHNLFPPSNINLGYTGRLPQYGGSDPLEEILKYGSQNSSIVQQPQSNRLQQIAQQNIAPSSGSNPRMQFGGVTGDSSLSTAGSDILNRAKGYGEKIFSEYGKPQITAGEMLAKGGIKPNDQDPGFTQAVKNLDPNERLKNEKIAAEIENDQKRTAAYEKSINDKGWTSMMIPDPNNPEGPPISVRINNNSGKVEPITLEGQNVGPLTKPGTPPRGLLNQPKNLAAIRDMAQRALKTASLMRDKEGKLTPDILANIGGSRILPRRYIPGGMPANTMDAETLMKQFKAQQVLDVITEMKNQSRTGATGFGALNLRELGVLENAASRLNPWGSEEAYAQELNDIVDRLNLIMQDDPSTSLNKPISNHAPTNEAGKVLVRNKATGQTGYVSEQFLNSGKYERVR